jgi:signal transduction histidine kinase
VESIYPQEYKMNIENNDDLDWHPLGVVICIVGLIALAWSGLLDGLSTQYLDNALLGSGAIYATARGINALVSVLQGTEMNAFLLTFTVGELLDPINDLIERFSGVMMLAISSLAMQKILLEVVSHTTFNILLTVLGGGVIATSIWGTSRQYAALSKFFFITVIIRFSLALVVLANSWADVIFLEENDEYRHVAMQEFQGELSLIGSRAGLIGDMSDDIRKVEGDIQRNEAAQKAEQAELYLNRTRLEQAEAELEALDDIPWWKKMMGETTVAIEGKKTEIAMLKKAIADSKYTISALVESHEAQHDRLKCLKLKAIGESCSIADSMASALSAMDVKKQIESLGVQVSDFASNIINLLMSLILKSIVLPLIFLYVLLHSAGSLFRPGDGRRNT